MPDFHAFPKIPRYTKVFGSMAITEKLDGTNACVVIEQIDEAEILNPECLQHWTDQDDVTWGLFAQSRKRMLTPDSDNYGFCRWVVDHAGELSTLGHGYHFGEWWGGGIQRGYGLDKDDKRLSLFNVNRPPETLPPCVGQVPILARCRFSLSMIEHWMEQLREHGSYAAPGYYDPEGVMCWVDGIRQYVKAPLDPAPKNLDS